MKEPGSLEETDNLDDMEYSIEDILKSLDMESFKNTIKDSEKSVRDEGANSSYEGSLTAGKGIGKILSEFESTTDVKEELRIRVEPLKIENIYEHYLLQSRLCGVPIEVFIGEYNDTHSENLEIFNKDAIEDMDRRRDIGEIFENRSIDLKERILNEDFKADIEEAISDEIFPIEPIEPIEPMEFIEEEIKDPIEKVNFVEEGLEPDRGTPELDILTNETNIDINQDVAPTNNSVAPTNNNDAHTNNNVAPTDDNLTERVHSNYNVSNRYQDELEEYDNILNEINNNNNTSHIPGRVNSREQSKTYSLDVYNSISGGTSDV